MSERNPFQQNPVQNQGGLAPCEEWEALLADAIDGTLSGHDKAVFEAHGSHCPMCAELLAQATQGREWMTFLHEEPPVPADLVTRILERTSGASLPQLAEAAAAESPVIAPHVAQLAMRRAFRDSRILMTVAMAFFSIMLTLNLVGIRFNTLTMADLKPSSLQTNAARQFYRTKQQMVSYYDGLRLVYEVESKMREFRRDAETDQPKGQPGKDNKPGTPQGSAHKNGGKLRNQEVLPDGICGRDVLAGLELGSDAQVLKLQIRAERSLA